MVGEIIMALLVEPGVPARPVLIENNRESLRSFLGGQMREDRFWNDATVVLSNRHTPHSERNMNRVITVDGCMVTIIAGAFLICELDSDNRIVTISDALFGKYLHKFMIPDRFIKRFERGYDVHHVEMEDDTDPE